MPERDLLKLGKMFNHPHRPTETLAEHIATNNLKTEERTTARGIVLIKVYFRNGIVREYEKSHINTTKSFGI